MQSLRAPSTIGYYNSISKGYNKLYGEEQRKKARLLKEHLRIKGLLLDIGAGTGIATEEFKDQATCILLDPSFKMLKKANGLCVCAKSEFLPFKDKIFETIVSLTSLHHTNIKRTLAEIKRVVKENASIGISMLKKSNKIPKELRKWKTVIEEKDIIYLKASEK